MFNNHQHRTAPALPSAARRPYPLHLLLLAFGLLGGCGAITVKTDPARSERTIAASTRSALPARAAAMPERQATAASSNGNRGARSGNDTAAAQAANADGLRLARLLRDQQRLQAASEVYAQLEQRQALAPLELLEYASVAAAVLPAADSLALYGRARQALRQSTLSAAASATLCNGLGRARMALGQTDAALADFDCTLQAEPDNVAALNAKGVLLDAAARHAEARALFARANQLAPADLRILNNLALSHLASQDNAEAIRLLRQAQAPDQPALALNLALAYSLQGDQNAASATLRPIMSEALATLALADFSARRARIAAGAPVAGELLAASRQQLALREANGPGNE